MTYYDPTQQWQPGWEQQTPPVRSGASSAVPREESAAAFSYQFEEVERAIDNLHKSGKMFGMQNRSGRMLSGGGPRAHSGNDYSDSRGGGHQSSNLQTFYASQRHQSSRGSNEAEQMMQTKRRMAAAQRERELRNYHQEQQFNRTAVLAELSYGAAKPDRALSPGNMSEDDRRDLIARQRSALYGEGPFAESGGYVDETGTPRPGMPAPPHSGPPTASSGALRGHSPLAYEYGRPPPAEGGPSEGGPGSQSAGHHQRSRANSTASPQSNPAGGAGQQQSSRTSTSSPGGSPGTKPGPGGGSAVAPIGTRPSGGPPGSNTPGGVANPAMNKRSSPLSHGYSAPGNNDNGTPTSTGAGSNPPSATAEGGSMGLGWGGRPGVWGNGKSGLGVQASVWG